MTVLINLLAFTMMTTCAALFYRITVPFVTLTSCLPLKVLFFLLYACTWGMVIWIGDPNLLYLMPFFVGIFLLCTKGDLFGRLAMAVILFCLAMSASALTDSYIRRYLPYMREADLVISYFVRTLTLLAVALILHHFMKETRISLSRRYWQLVLTLALMPFVPLFR